MKVMKIYTKENNKENISYQIYIYILELLSCVAVTFPMPSLSCSNLHVCHILLSYYYFLKCILTATLLLCFNLL